MIVVAKLKEVKVLYMTVLRGVLILLYLRAKGGKNREKGP